MAPFVLQIHGYSTHTPRLRLQFYWPFVQRPDVQQVRLLSGFGCTATALMSQQVTFDWLTDEDAYLREAAHAGLSSSAHLFSDGERRLVLILLRSLAALLILVAAAGSAALSPSQRERMQTEDELRAVLNMEEDAWRAKDKDRHAALIDPQVDGEWVGEWRDNWGASSDTGHIYTLGLGPTVRLGDDLIEVEVYVALPRTAWWQPAVRRETRFYRHADGMWLRTLPPEEYWGEQIALETQHVTFRYFEADAESVRLAASRLDSAIADLHSILGLAPVAEDQRVEVVIKPGLVHSWDWTSGVLEVTSPALAQVPRGLSDAEYVAERVFCACLPRAERGETWPDHLPLGIYGLGHARLAGP